MALLLPGFPAEHGPRFTCSDPAPQDWDKWLS